MSDVLTVKAIETKYDGHRFRARGEARWAVWFNHLKLKYEYEPEGFNLGDKCYLPDFWLPQLNSWFEVKPADPALIKQDEIDKIKLLVGHSKRNGLIALGPPRLDESQIWSLTPEWVEKYDQGHIRSPIFSDLDGHTLPLRFIVMASNELALVNFAESEGKGQGFHGRKFNKAQFMTSPDDLINAFKAAGYARFEHGECG